MPECEDCHVSGESAGLQDERDLDQNFARHVFRWAVGGVSCFGGAVGDHELDEEVDADESCEDAARVEWREPWDVVEGTGEDEVGCTGVDWSAEWC